MPGCEELNIVDLLEVQLPGCVGCLPYSSLTESAADTDPMINDILTFVRAIIPGEPKDGHTLPCLPYTMRTSQDFFGISLSKETNSGLEHLTSFIQSQVNPQSHKPQNPLPQHSPVHPAFITQSHSPAFNNHHSSDNCLQPSLVNCNAQQSVLPTTQLEQLALTPHNRKHRHSSSTSKSHTDLPSHGQTQSPSLILQNLELELHPSPSLFFRETQKEKLSTTDSTDTHIDVIQLHSVDHKFEKYCDELDSSAIKNQGIHPSPSYKESVEKNYYSYPKTGQEVNSPPLAENHSVKDAQGERECRLKANLVYRDHTKAGPNSSRYSKKVSASPSKVSHIKPSQSSSNDKVSTCSDFSKGQDKDGQGSSRDLVSLTTNSSRGQIKDPTSSGSSLVKDGTDFSKDQISPSTNSTKGQVRDSTSSSKSQEEKLSQDSIKGQFKTSPTSHKDSSNGQVISGRSASKNLEVKTSDSSRRGQVKEASASHKDQDVKNGSSSSKDSSVKATLGSHNNPQTTASSESDKALKSTYHKLPFISTDEQENKDNEDPRWKEQAQLSTSEERYRLARRLWKNPCVPDPNKNLTFFSSKQLKACQSLSFTNSRKRRRSQWCDIDNLQPLRKRQRRFENLAFSTNHIIKSKHQVMNEFLGNIQEPNISRQAAKKLENSHKEKQYMLDLALEEVNAIQMFYDGLPDQDLALTQEEVEMGWDATEHVYHVFGHIYGYNGQEFFP